MKGVYSIAEVVDDSNKRPEKTIFCLLEYDLSDYKMKIEGGKKVRRYVEMFDAGQLRSLDRVGIMVEKNGGKYFRELRDVAEFLNN